MPLGSVAEAAELVDHRKCHSCQEPQTRRPIPAGADYPKRFQPFGDIAGHWMHPDRVSQEGT